MSHKATVMAVVNQKGGTAKTTTCANLGVGLAQEGKKVLLIDFDPQGSLTICFGCPNPDRLSFTISNIMEKVIKGEVVTAREGIFKSQEGIDLMPGNIELSGMEVTLVNVKKRESVLKHYLDVVRPEYDYILIDCMSSLGMLTLNALAASDKVLIPVQAQYLSVKGLEQLLQTINKVRRQINPKLKIEGILLTMVEERTRNDREMWELIRETYGGKLKVYDTIIPRATRAKEHSARGTSIHSHDPKGTVSGAYKVLAKEVVGNAEKERKRQLDQLR